MTPEREAEVREILAEAISSTSPDLFSLTMYLDWMHDSNSENVTLDGDFTIEELRAIADWMEAHTP